MELRWLLRGDRLGWTDGTLSRPLIESLERSLHLSRQLPVALAFAQDAQEFIAHE
jgi:hypothetical protein